MQVSGFVVRQLCERPSNWRSTEGLNSFLTRHGVVGIQGIDTRSVTRRLRAEGVMMGVVTSELEAEAALEHLRNSPGYGAIDYVRKVTTPEPFTWEPTTTRPDGSVLEVGLVDCGVKFNILRYLADQGVRTTVYPCTASAEEILERKPHGMPWETWVPEATGPWLFTGLQLAALSLIERIPPGVSELARDVLGPSTENRDGAFALVPYRVPEDGLWFDLGSPAKLAAAEAAIAASGLA